VSSKDVLSIHLLGRVLCVLKDVDKGSDMRQDLNGKLVSVPDPHSGLATSADTSRGSGDDDSAGRQSRALRNEADQLSNGEDQVAVGMSAMVR
jgi:hypothetical protein